MFSTPDNEILPIQTRWQVITGAPCSGKTTVIENLARCGFRVKHEVARSYIDRRLSQGETLAQIKSDPLAFERHILLAKLEIERQLPPSEIIFLDRAVPDSIAYFELEGLPLAEPQVLSHRLRYERIFLFEHLGFEKDRVRWEDRSQAAVLESLLEQAYTDLAYDIIHVPVLPVQERTDFVLQHLIGDVPSGCFDIL